MPFVTLEICGISGIFSGFGCTTLSRFVSVSVSWRNGGEVDLHRRLQVTEMTVAADHDPQTPEQECRKRQPAYEGEWQVVSRSSSYVPSQGFNCAEIAMSLMPALRASSMTFAT